MSLLAQPLFSGTLASTAVHAGVAAGLYGWLALSEPAPIVAELDLTMSAILAAPPNAGGGRGAKRAPEWTDRLVAKPAVEAPKTAEEARREDATPSDCAGPCPDQALIGKGWGGGSGEGDGQFVPAETAARQPRWLRHFITSSDYPLLARREGKDGRVVLSVLIDREGRVVDARLLEGAYDALNAAALRGVRRAVFSPAYDADGRPVASRLTLPIRFELR